jgi:hypothetical protein
VRGRAIAACRAGRAIAACRAGLALVLLPALASAARGQGVEVAAVGGYRFGGSLGGVPVAGTGDTDGGLDVDDAAAFGVHVGYGIGEGEIELLYARQETGLRTPDLFTGVRVFDLALETWQLGGNHLFRDEDRRVRPYVGMGLGLTRLLPAPSGLKDETRFSASFAGGVKLWPGRHVGVRLEVRGFFTLLSSDSGTLCGSGHGCLISSTSSWISQVEARGGVTFRF